MPTAWKVALALGILAAGLHLRAFSGVRAEDTLAGSLEAKALDIKFRLRGPITPSGHVTVIGIDERSVGTYGLWPWDRSIVADLVDRLTEAKVRVIALDMSFVDAQLSGRHTTLHEIHEIYQEAVAGGLKVPEGVALEEGEAKRPTVPELDAYFERTLSEQGPDEQLAKAIFESGRVVWGLFGYRSREGVRSVNLSEEHLDACFTRVRPFLVAHLYEARTDAESGAEREYALEVPVDAPQVNIGYLNEGIESPLPAFSAATPYFGLINVYPDRDGGLRRAEVLQRYRDRLVPSLALRSVAAYLGSNIYPLWDAEQGQVLTVRLRVGSAEADGLAITDAHGAIDWMEQRAEELPPGPWEEAHVAKWEAWREERQEAIDNLPEDVEEFPPVDPVTLPGFAYGDKFDLDLDPVQQGRILINHLGRGRDFDTVSAVDVLEGKADPELLAGRIALVGVTALGTYDQRVTPYDGMIPGVYVQSAIMDNILSRRLLVRWGWMAPIEAVILLGIALLVGLALPRIKGAVFIVLFVVLGVGIYIAVDLYVFVNHGVELFLFTPLAFFVGTSGVVLGLQLALTDREKRKVRRAFQHYLAPSVLESVLKDESKLALNPTKAELSVLFSDIRGFTTISERLPPEQLAIVLNTYLTPMTHVVFEQGGTLDKYMGDAIMAFWGDPIPFEDHALRACTTAVKMIEVCDRLAEEFVERGWPPIEIGIGINTGQVSVGNFGSDMLFDYTVMGDSVNLASRLEGTNKQYGTKIIISEATLAKVSGQVVVRPLDAVRVKGKREPVRIYELLALGQPTPEQKVFLDLFSEALVHYKEQLWDRAIALFQECLEHQPGDYAAQLYIARSNAMKETPPGDDWDGVYTMTTK
ncbi:MAG: adenylate/guanylate cyclase domain-containing protein [Deltaproteobacteria bacterium]|nr:adenylate/guanylate cyclase domain-containing protein [Deltaproteobacteria bacterium]